MSGPGKRSVRERVGYTPCRDSPGWRSYLGQTCSDYKRLGWCNIDHVVNRSAGGSLLGSPEKACCECGAQKQRLFSGPSVRQVIFFATHTLHDDLDRRLINHYVEDLSKYPSARMFVPLFRESATSLHRVQDISRVGMESDELAQLRSQASATGAEVWLWGQSSLSYCYPRLAAALANATAKGSAMRRTPRTVSKYFFFHASLALWMHTFGHSFPAIDFFWRMEPDSLFAGSLPLMLELSSAVKADLLLPNIASKAANEGWPHWKRNRDEFESVPVSQLHQSLVSFGRYSRRFLRMVMGQKWAAGHLAYEEIALPTACAIAAAADDNSCTMESFWRSSKIRSAKKCVYRPVWNCSDFLQARRQETRELWHPVKDRRCLVEWLDRAALSRFAWDFYDSKRTIATRESA